jgi:hypothetical protein
VLREPARESIAKARERIVDSIALKYGSASKHEDPSDKRLGLERKRLVNILLWVDPFCFEYKEVDGDCVERETRLAEIEELAVHYPGQNKVRFISFQ